MHGKGGGTGVLGRMKCGSISSGTIWVCPSLPSELPSLAHPTALSIPPLAMVHVASGSEFAASKEEETTEEIDIRPNSVTKRKKNAAGLHI